MATHLPAPVLRKEIRRILKGEDLEKITPKIVRLRLEKKYSVDLVDRKQEISQICKQVIDTLSDTSESEDDADVHSQPEPQSTPAHTQHHHQQEQQSAIKEQQQERVGQPRASGDSATSDSGSDTSSSSGSDDDNSAGKASDKKSGKKVNGNTKLSNSLSPSSPPHPPKKKAKTKTARSRSPSIKSDSDKSDNEVDEKELDDEELARRLQEQERPIRKAARHLVNKDHTKPKKTKERTKRQGGVTGYMKTCVLSDELAQLMGTDRMARHQVVKRMHEIIKERDLQDPRNKQFHICDADLLPIFGKKRVKTFGMMKYLNKHISSE